MSTKNETSESAPVDEPSEHYKTDWTPDGRYRLDVAVWPGAVVLTCETEGASFPKGERFTFLLGRVVVLTGNLRPDAERFAEHAFGFYSAEVAAFAADAVRNVFASLKEPDPNATTPTPPRGIFN